MDILLIDNKTSYLPHILSLLKKFGQVIVSDIDNALTINNYDIVVLSGGHHTYITEHPETYEKEINLVKNTAKPILGVCLGAEIVAYSFGAKLTMLSNKQKGLVTVEVINNDNIFENKNCFSAYENHAIAILDISDELVGLAKSLTGFEVIKHKTKPIYGFQFHPEIFQDMTYGDEVFINALNKLVKSSNKDY